MRQLNLPAFQASIRREGGVERIFDMLRRRYVALTPEEWVRQHFVHYLADRMRYPAALMANEVALSLNGMSRRCDTVVYSRDDGRPLMIVEYKSPDVAISQRVFAQILRYNIAMQVEWLVVSNGLRHFCCHVNRSDGSYEFINGLPDYDALNRRDGAQGV